MIFPTSSFPRVPLAVPYWNGATYRAISASLLSGAVIEGRDLEAFESALIEHLQVKHALLCGSGTLALELALRACGVGAGDEVIIPAFCCSAVVPPILELGAIPVLADIGAEVNVTVDTVSAVLTKKSRAVIVPHLFGNPADIEGIVDLAHAKRLHVIDDAAQALGATIDGRPVGGFGDVGIVSFGSEKVCFGLGGGALLANRPESISRCAQDLAAPKLATVLATLAATQFYRRWRRWTFPLQAGSAKESHSSPDSLPAPYRREGLANLQAAVGLNLLQSLDENLAARRARVNAYRELLGDAPGLELITHRSGSACLTQVARIRLQRRDEDSASALIAALRNRGYEVQGSYVPIHLLSCFERCVWDSLPVTERLWSDLIELPCEPGVSLRAVEHLSSLIRGFLSKNNHASFSIRPRYAQPTPQ